MNATYAPFLLAQTATPAEAAVAVEAAAPVEAATPAEAAVAVEAAPAVQAAAPAEVAATTVQPVVPGPVTSTPPPPMAGGLGQFLPLILIFAILYFVMIRPAQRKEKDRKKEISELRAGVRVLFAGGLIGTIVEVKGATFRVEVADGVVVEIARGAVQRALQGDETPAEPDAR